ncbi:hypothetical protein X740_28500 [Mesorhizobium sp. LNHC221B00]|nr:hypothetical protein X740_28500 [Mesorhizobium sp. LNHC221B00]
MADPDQAGRMDEISVMLLRRANHPTHLGSTFRL